MKQKIDQAAFDRLKAEVMANPIARRAYYRTMVRLFFQRRNVRAFLYGLFWAGVIWGTIFAVGLKVAAATIMYLVAAICAFILSRDDV